MALLELERIKRNINILFQNVRCLMAKSDENCPLVATEWSSNHTILTGNPYTAGTYVFYNGHVYKCLFDNEGILPTNTTYWLDLGEGHLLAEEQSDWNATGGRRYILNKPTNTSDFNNDGEDGSSPYVTQDDLSSLLPTPQNLDEVLTEGNTSLLDAYIGKIFLYNPNLLSGNGYVSITGDKNRFNFYNNVGDSYGYLFQDVFSFTDSSPYQLSIKKPTVITDNRTATFQDASGTVAYLSDIPQSFGFYAQTTESVFITGLTEQSLIAAGEGTLGIPPDVFQIGDSFHLKVSGKISNANNAQLVIQLKANGLLIGTTGALTLPATTNKNWELTSDFTVRQIGAAGSAKLKTSGKFLYNKDASNAFEGQIFDYDESLNFDTTIANNLEITATWLTSDPSNSINSHTLILNKLY
jgi:hypothetical protein